MIIDISSNIKRKKPATVQSTLVTGGRFKRSTTFLSVTQASDAVEESVLIEGEDQWRSQDLWFGRAWLAAREARDENFAN